MISGNKIQKNVLVTSDGVCAGHVVTVVTPPACFTETKSIIINISRVQIILLVGNLTERGTKSVDCVVSQS